MGALARRGNNRSHVHHDTKPMMKRRPNRFFPPRLLQCMLLLACLLTRMEVHAMDVTELRSAYDFPTTLARVEQALTGAGMGIFARIDHQAAAAGVGMQMAPATVLVYGNPRGGTPLMQAAPQLALDLPLKVLVRQDEAGRVLVDFHPATALLAGAGLPAERAAPLQRAEGIIAAAVAAGE